MYNIYSSCRLCLKQDDSTLVNCTEIVELSNSVEDIFGFKISSTDDCSTKICRECISKVTSFSMYRDGVLNNQKSIKQYNALQVKLELSVKNNQEADYNLAIASHNVSQLSPVQLLRPLHIYESPAHLSFRTKTYARKSTAKPITLPVKSSKRIKKLKIVCRPLKESDVMCVVLNDKDKKILNLKGKTVKKKQSHAKLKASSEPNEINSINKNSGKKSKAITKLSNSIQTLPPLDIKMNNIVEPIVPQSLNQLTHQSTDNFHHQSIPTDQQIAPCSAGYFYINPAAITKTSNTFRPILPKPQLPVDQIAEKMGTNSTAMINAAGSSTPYNMTASAHLPVITEIFNHAQNNTSVGPKSPHRRLIPTQNTCQYIQQNTNNFAFAGANIADIGQRIYTTRSQYNTNNLLHPPNQPIPNSTIVAPHPSNLMQNNQILSAALFQNQPCIINPPLNVAANSPQMNRIPTSANEYIADELLMQRQNHQIAQINTRQSREKFNNSEFIPTTNSDKQETNEKRVKVLSVGELNMKAAAVRKLPLLITLVKIKNEVQIKLTDSKGIEIHYTNLSPQEQTAVKSNLLQPSSKEQILGAIKSCTLDKYSQDMLTAFGITMRAEGLQKYETLTKQFDNDSNLQPALNTTDQ